MAELREERCRITAVLLRLRVPHWSIAKGSKVDWKPARSSLGGTIEDLRLPSSIPTLEKIEGDFMFFIMYSFSLELYDCSPLMES